jgi:hypothetical protein
VEEQLTPPFHDAYPHPSNTIPAFQHNVARQQPEDPIRHVRTHMAGAVDALGS